MASIQKRANRKSPYRVLYRAPDGRSRSRSFARRVDAEKFAATVETDKIRGAWIDPRRSRISFGDWASRWLATQSELKPKTYAGYDSLLRTHVLPTFGGVPLERIEPIAVKEWVSALRQAGLSASRTRQAYRVLSACMRAAVETGYLAKSPCIGVRLPRIQYREMLFLTDKQVDLLAGAVPGRYKALVYVLAYCGLRWGEAAAIRLSRCDLLRGRIEIVEALGEVGARRYFGSTKTHQTRVVVVPRFVRDILAKHIETFVESDPDALVFTAPKGGPLRHRDFWGDVWNPAVEKANLPIQLRIHDLRHTCAALSIAEGANPKIIQTQLGHSTIAVTFDRYGHLFPDDMDQLADRLDARWRVAQTLPNQDRDVVVLEPAKQRRR